MQRHVKRAVIGFLLRICFCMAGLPVCSFCTGMAGKEAAPDDKSFEIILHETFEHLIPPDAPAADIAKLEKKGIPPNVLSGFLKPEKWSLLLNSVTIGCRMTKEENFWRITGGEGLTLRSPTIRERHSRKFQLSLTAEVPDECQAPTRLGIGVLPLGNLQKDKKILVRQKIRPGETAELNVPLFFERGLPRFRILLEITGDVILKEMTVTKLPDDLHDAGITLLEGTVTDCSAIPDPRKSDYPDCRFTMRFEADSICDGVPCPREIQLLADGFRKYQFLPTAELKKGDKIRCCILPFENLPATEKEAQQADDLDLFNLENFYLLEYESVRVFHPGTVPFSDTEGRSISIFERKINPPLSAELEKIQAEAIQAEKKKIGSMLDGWTVEKKQQTEADFQKAWDAEKAKDKPGFNRVGEYVWRNVDNSFWCLPETYTLIGKYDPITPWNLECLTALRDFLRANGCQLIVSLLPDMNDISSRVINPGFRDVPDFFAAQTVQELLDRGIEAFYVSDELIKSYNRYPWAFFFPANPHPADTAQDVMADALAARLKRFGFAESLDRGKFSSECGLHRYEEIEYHHRADYLFPADCDIGENRPGAAWQCRHVLYDRKGVSPDPASPILMVGNSYMQTPTNWPDSLPALLAEKIAVPIDFYRIKGYGPVIAFIQSLNREPERYLKGKRVMILAMGARHIHFDVKFKNIREMDRQMLLLTGKTLGAILDVSGNTKDKPSFAAGLSDSAIFTIPEKGSCTVANIAIPKQEKGSGCAVLAVPVCAKAPCPARLRINGVELIVPECYREYQWNKIVTELPSGTERVKIELTGEPGTVLAVGDIQIYQ